MQHESAKSFDTWQRTDQHQGPSLLVNPQSYLTNPTDVLVPRLLVEAEVLVETKADVVAIQAVGELVEVEEVLLERAGYGGL